MDDFYQFADFRECEFPRGDIQFLYTDYVFVAGEWIFNVYFMALLDSHTVGKSEQTRHAEGKRYHGDNGGDWDVFNLCVKRIVCKNKL